MRLSRMLPFVLTSMALGAGCGSDDSGSEKKNVPIDDVPEMIASEACAALSDCYGAELSWVLGGEDCKTRVQAQFEDAISALEASIEAGRTTYDGTRIEACLAAVRAAGCNVGEAFESDVCRSAIDGKVETGGECAFDHECSGDAYCKSSSACPGTCAAAEAVGGNCETNDQCSVGLYCASDTKRCYQPPAAGDLCGGSEATECAPGLFCAGANDSGKAGNCRALSEVLVKADGEACNPDAGELCVSGLTCTLDTFDPATSAIAWKCAARAASGAACKAGFPEHCPNGEFCELAQDSLDGTCRALPEDGEACAVPPFGQTPTLCAPYTRCESGTCRSLASIGAACQDDAICHSEHCLAGTCQAAGACG